VPEAKVYESQKETKCRGWVRGFVAPSEGFSGENGGKGPPAGQKGGRHQRGVGLWERAESLESILGNAAGGYSAGGNLSRERKKLRPNALMRFPPIQRGIVQF